VDISSAVEVSGQLHGRFNPDGISCRYPLGRRPGGPQVRSVRYAEERRCVPDETEPRCLGCPTRTIISGLPELTRLPYRITGVSDFIHCPEFNNYKKKNKHDVSETGSVSFLR
jgi:hypothetical protein